MSTALIVGTLVFFRQLNFIQNKQLGYEAEQVVALRVMGIQPRNKIESLEKELQQLSFIKGTSLSQSYPGHSASGRTLSLPEALEGQSADLTSCRAHPGIFEVLDLKLIAGKPMKILEEGDSITQIVLNKSAVAFFGLDTGGGHWPKGRCKFGHFRNFPG